MADILSSVHQFLSRFVQLPRIRPIDIVEIIIFSVLIYFFMAWIQRTRAYTLLKGILIVILFIIVATIFGMSEILWVTQRLASVAVMALVIIFQPELRKALESLGNKSILSGLFRFDYADSEEQLSDKTISEIVRAVNDMSEVRTGALIVIEQKILLDEYIGTGIRLDSLVSSQLLINIFEHNTPLHDGAVVIRGNKIAAATCYLPLSDNAKINKRYGTRHRAGLGISEASDAFTVIVSEETGRVSYTYMGVLTTGVTASGLREQLHQLQKHTIKSPDDRRRRLLKGAGDET